MQAADRNDMYNPGVAVRLHQVFIQIIAVTDQQRLCNTELLLRMNILLYSMQSGIPRSK